MKPPQSRLVDAKTVELLLTEGNGQLDRTTFPKTTIPAYVLNDGGAGFVFPDGRGRHYTSYNDMLEEHLAMEAWAETGNDMATDLFPSGEDFIERIPQLVTELPRLIDVEASTLDTTESSIDAIDAAIDAAGSEPFLAGDVFQSLIAYVGEVIRRAIGGRWEQIGRASCRERV